MSTNHSTHSTGAGHAGHAARKADTQKSAHTQERPGIPTLDIGKLLERFRLPGVDFPALAQAQRKNIEALQQANEKAYAGVIALAQRQAEIFQETMGGWQEAAKELRNKNPAESVAAQADLAGKAVGNALAHMRELAEMAAKSQGEAYEIIRKRAEAGMQEFRDHLNKKP